MFDIEKNKALLLILPGIQKLQAQLFPTLKSFRVNRAVARSSRIINYS